MSVFGDLFQTLLTNSQLIKINQKLPNDGRLLIWI